MSTKQRVLELLEQNRERYLSGAAIGSSLELTRAAVWAAVEELRGEGHLIDAVTSKGYRLAEKSGVLTGESVLPLVTTSGLSQLRFYRELSSTNDTSKKLAVEGAPDGTVVLAEHQTAGKGRRGRGFFSPPGTGIYMSFLLRPGGISAQDATLVTTAASVAVCRCIQNITGKEPGIKWVNDVYLEGKKICGILTEAGTDLESGGIEWLVLGIGINFSLTPEQIPPELREIVGSVLPGCGDPRLRIRMAAELINQVLPLERLLEGGRFLEEYRERSLVLGRDITVHLLEKEYRARAVAIDREGCLLVERESGEQTLLRGGEVSIRREGGFYP